MTARVDVNADLGESYGVYRIGNDDEMLNYVSSVNIACGFHAGDAGVMNRTVRAAVDRNVAIGAHPGFPDLIGFGRRDIHASPSEVYDMVVYQIGALQAFVSARGTEMQHVKPHGALYNQASRDPDIAQAIAAAVYDVNPNLVLFGLSGSELVSAGDKQGLRTASEVLADRTYQADGSLTPRSQANALLRDADVVVQQALRMVREHKVRTPGGIDLSLKVDTICLHGDGDSALDLARGLHTAFQQEGILIRSLL
ncbi:MAG: lactam utilization protein LamB [Alicyclobacillus sp. RIFOXYA1_FULL_53_8]|nr:MAG: lactam utilization protein LamB [Alicyclobacillus sp. RIFOXYA1_FULL_53_8]